MAHIPAYGCYHFHLTLDNMQNFVFNFCLLTLHVSLQLVIIDFIKDPDPRVRSVALETLVDLHDSGTSLESTVYEHASQTLYDDHERVRTAALRLVTALALSSPDRFVLLSHP